MQNFKGKDEIGNVFLNYLSDSVHLINKTVFGCILFNNHTGILELGGYTSSYLTNPRLIY